MKSKLFQICFLTKEGRDISSQGRNAIEQELREMNIKNHKINILAGSLFNNPLFLLNSIKKEKLDMILVGKKVEDYYYKKYIFKKEFPEIVSVLENNKDANSWNLLSKDM